VPGFPATGEIVRAEIQPRLCTIAGAFVALDGGGVDQYGEPAVWGDAVCLPVSVAVRLPAVPPEGGDGRGAQDDFAAAGEDPCRHAAAGPAVFDAFDAAADGAGGGVGDLDGG